MPEKTSCSEKLSSAINFYLENSEKIQKENSQIRHVLRTIKAPEHTVHPLRMRLWSQAATTCTPGLGELEDQYKKWFSDCELNLASAKDSLEDLERIQGRITDLWLRAGTFSPTRDADPLVALKAAQNSLKQGQITENITSYLHTMALLIYSSRKALEYLACMFSLWVDIGKTQCRQLFRELDTRREVLSCSLALCYAQRTWNALMNCPWTVACAIHLLAEHSAQQKGMEDAGNDNEEDDIRVLSGNPARPPNSAAVFAAVDRISLQRMLEGCFRLTIMRRENTQLVAVVKPFTGGGSQNHKRSVTVDFVSDVSGRGIKEADVFQMIREYWKREASSNPDKSSRPGFQLLSELADTSELSDSHLHTDFGQPKAHCECILAQHWMAKRQLTNQAFPLIGVSNYACRTCNTFLREVVRHTRKQQADFGPEFLICEALKRMIPGRTDVYRLCTVPEQSPMQIKKAVADLLLSEVEDELCFNQGLMAVLKWKLSRACGEDIDSDIDSDIDFDIDFDMDRDIDFGMDKDI